MEKTVIVVPTYNERQNVVELIPRIFEAVPEAMLLVVDDNSPDGTAAVVEEIMKTNQRVSILKRQKKEGLGKAYIHAFQTLLVDPSVSAI